MTSAQRSEGGSSNPRRCRRSRSDTAWRSGARCPRNMSRGAERWSALTLALVILAACTAPAATPSVNPSATASITPTTTPTQTATAEPTATTLVRTPEPLPTGSPIAAAPTIRVVAQVFSVATAASLIEVVGSYRTTAEADLRRWVPTLLDGLDKIRVDPYEAS